MPTYYHYSSRVAAQLAIAANAIRPGHNGSVYLTDEQYESGAEAANRLAIPVFGPVVGAPSGPIPLTKPIEVVCVIPDQLMTGAALVGPSIVDQLRDFRTGAVLYLGGGREFKFSSAISVAGLEWRALGVP